MHCRDFALGIGRQIKSDYVDAGQVRFVYRHYPFLGEESVWAAEATECASDQGKFWEYHDILYDKWAGTNVGAYSYNNLVGFAQIIELDMGQFENCMTERHHVERVRSEQRFAEANNITSTPTVFVNGERVRGGEYGVFRDAIEAALAAAQ